jgi:hypothetical protein
MNEVDPMTPLVSATPIEPASTALAADDFAVIELDNPVLAAVMQENLADPWETVAFPGAMIDVATLPEAASVDLVTSLQQQNQTLRDRVEYLEESLKASQTNLRQEVSRWESLALQGDERLHAQAQAQEAAIGQYVADLTAAQNKAAELFAQLELAHQGEQRQQIVMDTLNVQWRNSQERVAQLERECATVHQQNVDQAQQVLQQEHQLRDLQARLQRQQRYTLQYKAALEKSLEVPSSSQPGPVAPTLLSEATQAPTKAVSMPKPSPVQPWSAPTGSEDYSQKAWLNSLLSASGEFPADQVLANFDWQPERPIEPAAVSFNLDELPTDNQIELDLEQFNLDPTTRLSGWEPGSNTSPFITLHPVSAGETDAVGDDDAVATPELTAKRESLAAVDLPTFRKSDGELEPDAVVADA